jgi:cystathionine beta-lyase/cystathionine gamma-synthase
MKPSTRAIHVGQAPDPATGATIPPVSISSTYTQAGPGQHKGYEYSRTHNPTRQNLEACLAALDGGAAAATFASGLAATTTLLLAHLKTGDSLAAYGDMYGGTYRLFERVFRPWGLDARYCDQTDPSAIAALIDKTTRVVWIETPTNPMLRLIDIRGVAQAVRAAEQRLGTKLHLVVDNTFASPALQRPIELGADIVLYSSTKYLGGHSDVVGGALVTADAARMEPLRFAQNAVGAVNGPWDAYLVHRGVKTLEVRMRQHCENALRVAGWAAEQKVFDKVVYPGLPGHPDHALAKRQMAGFGGMVSVVLKGGMPAVNRFMGSLKLFACAESLGGVESLANHPAIMTHASIPRERREKLGIVDGLVRLSVGIEDADDLIADLQQAAQNV